MGVSSFYRKLAFAFGAKRYFLIYEFFNFFGCVIGICCGFVLVMKIAKIIQTCIHEFPSAYSKETQELLRKTTNERMIEDVAGN